MATDKVTTYKPSEMYNMMKNVIESNDVLIKKGELPVSLSVVGPHGIGKTTVIRELVQDLGKDFFKLNLSQITEPAELVGFYNKEYELILSGKQNTWCTENMIPDYASRGYERTGRTRTSPCPPDWVVNLKPGGVLCLDDFSRGNQLLMQAVMEICNEGTMIGWDLSSKGIQVILSENPDDGEYNVQSVDAAHGSRMAKAHMVWDSKDWASRAEKIKTDPRLINFVLWKPELFENKKQDGISASGAVSPRMMDKFFSLVGTIDQFDKHLDKITQYGDITVGKHIVGELVNFINKRLDKLPNVDDLIMNDDIKVAKTKLTECCGNYEKDSQNFKMATSAILATRLYNYARHYNKDMSKDNIKQYGEIMLHTAFTVDQKLMMVKQTVTLGNKFATLAGDPRFLKYMTS